MMFVQFRMYYYMFHFMDAGCFVRPDICQVWSEDLQILSAKTDLALACGCASISASFFFPQERNYPVSPARNYNVLLQQTWHAVFFSSEIIAVISITFYLLLLLTMYQILCNIKANSPHLLQAEIQRLGGEEEQN